MFEKEKMMHKLIFCYKIKDLYGTDLSSTKLGLDLCKSMIEHIDLGYSIEVDFEDVRTVTNGWSRNAFGIIVKNNGEKYFKDNIKLINISENVQQSILEGISELV